MTLNTQITKLRMSCINWSKAGAADSLQRQTRLRKQIESFQNRVEASGYRALGLTAMVWFENLATDTKHSNHRQTVVAILRWLDSAEAYLRNPLNKTIALSVAKTIPGKWRKDLTILFLKDIDPELEIFELKDSDPIELNELARIFRNPSNRGSSHTSIPDMFREKIKLIYPVLLDYAGFIRELADNQPDKPRLTSLIASSLIDDYKSEIKNLIEIAEAGKLQEIIDICKTAIEYCNDFQQNSIQDLSTVGFVLENFPLRLLDRLSIPSQPGLLAN